MSVGARVFAPMSCPCRSLTNPPSVSPAFGSNVRVSRRRGCLAPASWSLRWSHLPIRGGRRAPNKTWRLSYVSCFKNGEEEEEESSSDGDCFGPLENKPAQQLDKSDLNLSSSDKGHWFSNMQKAAYRIIRIDGEPWAVPWTAETIIQVMLLWIASFWFVGSWIIPFLAHTAGYRKDVLTHRGQALYSLLTDIAEGLVGIAILHNCLARFRPLPSSWFRFSWKGRWKLDVVLGCLMFPLVNRLSQINIDLVPLLPAPPVGVSSVEQSIVARDPVAMALYAVVVSVCAPVGGDRLPWVPPPFFD